MTLLLIPSHYPHYTLFQKDYFSFGKSIEIKRSPSPGQGTSSTGGISQQTRRPEFKRMAHAYEKQTTYYSLSTSAGHVQPKSLQLRHTSTPL